MIEKVTNRLSDDNMRLYLAVLGATGIKKQASAAVGCTTDSTSRWINESAKKVDERYLLRDPMGDEPDEWFHEAVARAARAFVDGPLREILVKLATGIDEVIVYKGRVQYVPDTSDPEAMKLDKDGDPVWPPKRDAQGQPIPLTIRRIYPNITQFMTERLDPEFKPKSEVDLTSGGKPVFFPLPSGSKEEWIAEQGLEVVKVKKPDAAA